MDFCNTAGGQNLSIFHLLSYIITAGPPDFNLDMNIVVIWVSYKHHEYDHIIKNHKYLGLLQIVDKSFSV